MAKNEQEYLNEIREAMQDPHVALHIVPTFTHGRAVQVKIKSRKVGPLLFPVEGKTLTSVLMMLGTMAEEKPAPKPAVEVEHG